MLAAQMDPTYANHRSSFSGAGVCPPAVYRSDRNSELLFPSLCMHAPGTPPSSPWFSVPTGLWNPCYLLVPANYIYIPIEL